jgi:hypothetical protein
MKLAIVSPALRLSRTTEESIDRLVALCDEREILVTRKQDSTSGVIFVRNKLASEFLVGAPGETRAPDDALLTVDGDAGFDAEDILEWLDSGLDVIALPRPCKSIDWTRIHAAVLDGASALDLPQIASDLVFNTLPDGSTPAIQAESGATFLEVAEAPAHTMMIRRRVLSQIVEMMGPDLAYDNGPNSGAWAFFQEMTLGKRLLSDDFFFCGIARGCGFKIYAHVEALARHVGEHVFEGSIKARMATTSS